MQPILLHKRVFNKAYLPYLDSNVRIEIFMGGGGSGKSYFLAQRDIYRILTQPEYNLLVMRKVAASNHDSCFADYVSIISKWRLDSLFKISSSRGGERITCVNGNEIIFGGCKDVRELEKVKGIRAKGGPITKVRFEEASEFTQADFNQINNVRLRGETKTPKQMTLSFNPISAQHWIKKRFFDRPEPGTLFFEHNNTDPNALKAAPVVILKTTHVDNAFYGEAERAELLKLKDVDEYFYNVYVLGNWGIVGNVVFTNYIIEDFPYDFDSFDTVYQGLDFGFNHAQALELCGFRDGELYVFDEVYLKGKTNSECIEIANDYFSNRGILHKVKNHTITGDSEAPDKIREWRDAGYSIQGAKKGPGSVEYGYNFLKSRRIHIHASRCPGLAAEIPFIQYRKDAQGEPTDQIVDAKNDAVAALRYATEELWHNEGYDEKILSLLRNGKYW